MCPFSYAITHNNVTDLEFHAMIRNAKKKKKMIMSRLEHFSMKSKSL